MRSRSIIGPIACRQLPLDGDRGAQRRLSLGSVERLIGGQVLAERAGRAEVGQVNRDLELFAGFQKVVAVVGADGDEGPFHIVDIIIIGLEADDAFIMAAAVVGGHVDGVACDGVGPGEVL